VNEDTPVFAPQLNELLNHHPYLHGAISGVSVRSASSGELIYTYNGDTRLTPASNMKIFTAAAALSTLGKDYTFHTELLTDGSIKRNVLKGNLYVKGKGDPTLLPEDFNQFAKELKNKGVKIISGNLVGDDSWYDDVRYSIDVPWSDETAYYGAQISALTASPDHDFDAGTVIVEVTPGESTNQKANITVSPKTDYVQIINETKTVAAEGETDINISRAHGTNVIKIEGTIPINTAIKKEWIAVWEPTKYALDLVKQSLKEQDIKLLGKIKVGTTPLNANLLLSHSSTPLSELLVPFMKLSNNSHGEILIKEMGKVFKGKGSWEDGLEVEKVALSTLGVQTNAMDIRDGSGISHINLVPANEITQLLYHTRQMEWFPSFLSSLPIAGSNEKKIGGTLRKRMKNISLKGNLKAKTGTLTSVSSLSGFIKTKSGETLVFSIILNHLKDDAEGKQIEEQIVNILANTER
jgi:D-alanyl-D-alanine carboxypeptidase/D-alanyl-D-alanine-endopeptidase (penicillin-binding protein 4)